MFFYLVNNNIKVLKEEGERYVLGYRGWGDNRIKGWLVGGEGGEKFVVFNKNLF